MLLSNPRAALAACAILILPLTSVAHGDASHATSKPRSTVVAHTASAETAFGRTGDPRQVARTVTIHMSDDMRFTPSTLEVKQGETVRLDVVNRGRVLHELVLGTADDLRSHATAMKQQPGMAHDEPHMVHVGPGRQGAMVWQFTQRGEFPFACLLPGHFEAGMAGKVVVR